MRLKKCEWGEGCVWFIPRGRYTTSPIVRKKYRIGSKKAIFLVKTFENPRKTKKNWYSCEGCIRHIIGSDLIMPLCIKKIIPLTERARKVLVLLKLE